MDVRLSLLWVNKWLNQTNKYSKTKARTHRISRSIDQTGLSEAKSIIIIYFNTFLTSYYNITYRIVFTSFSPKFYTWQALHCLALWSCTYSQLFYVFLFGALLFLPIDRAWLLGSSHNYCDFLLLLDNDWNVDKRPNLWFLSMNIIGFVNCWSD